MMSISAFLKCADYSYRDLLDADPQHEAAFPNRESREVRSGHFVPVKPTPLPKPELVIFSKDMARELGLDGDTLPEALVRFLGADQDSLPEFDFSWATPYALAIYGQPMYQQCPFGNGRGYGDGRAISIAEVKLESGQRWELQLKGAGPTPFRRTGDGRAVLRSSVREFLASEAMHHLGIDTTRALSLVVSKEETVARPWYSGKATKLSMDDPRLARFSELRRRQIVEQFASQPVEPDQMQLEAAAITCRVAPSFVRVGHLDLFARRARGDVPGVRGKEREEDAHVGLEQLRKLIDFAMLREFPSHPRCGLELLKMASERIAALTANWIRVGFVQGNFNSDNCLVAGRTMDYGPFGFMERFEPNWAMWVGGGNHFAFLNQMEAGTKNFETLVSAVLPALDEKQREEAEALMANQFAVATDALNDCWRAKMGLEQEWSAESNAVMARALELFYKTATDWTIGWRKLADVVEQPAATVAELNDAFYSPLSDAQRADWNEWIESLRALKPSAELMRRSNPKYVPREWMLVAAYEAARQGDYSVVHELHELFKQPYEEQPEMEAKYFRKAAAEVLEKPGVSYMT